MAPPIVVAVDPVGKLIIYIGVYYAAIPVGSAIGFIYDDLIATALGNWNWPFVFESIAMLVLFCSLDLFSKILRLNLIKNQSRK